MSLGLRNHVSRRSAGFQTVNGFRSKLTQVNLKEGQYERAGIVLDVSTDGHAWCSPPEDHVFITGTTGSGKTRRLIVPSVHLNAEAGCSMVITDPKGEVYGMTASYLKTKGYQTAVVDFRNPGRSTRWNPLSIPRELWNTGEEEKKDRALLMLRTISDMLASGIECSRDRFWESSAKSLFMGFAQYLLRYGKGEELSFSSISTLAFSAFENLRELNDDNLERDKLEELKAKKGTFYCFYDHLSDDDPIKKALAPVMITNAHQTFESIRVTFESMMAPYVNHKGLAEMMSESEIHPESIASVKTALFIIIPDDESTLYPIIDIMIDQIYTVLIDEANENGGKLYREVLFLLDEFGTIVSETDTIIPGFASMLSASRSRRMRFAIVCQSVMQLRKAYGPMADVILENCRTWAVLASRSHELTSMLQKTVGVRVSQYTGKESQLFSDSDLRQLKTGELLIVNDYGPYLGHIPDISEYGFENDTEPAVPQERKRAVKKHVKQKRYRWYSFGEVHTDVAEVSSEMTYEHHLGTALMDSFIAIMLTQDVNEDKTALLKRTREAIDKFSQQPALKPYMETYHRAYRHISMMSDEVLEKSRVLYTDSPDDPDDQIPF